MRELLDVVDEAEQFPLRIDLLPSAEREPIEPLVVADVAEDGLHGGEALTVADVATPSCKVGLCACAYAARASKGPSTFSTSLACVRPSS